MKVGAPMHRGSHKLGAPMGAAMGAAMGAPMGAPMGSLLQNMHFSAKHCLVCCKVRGSPYA